MMLSGCKEKVDISNHKKGEKAAATTLIELPRVGYIAPDFTLKGIYNQEFTLSQYRGKIVFITFWATWCGPCRSEMPILEILYNDLKKKGLVVLAISSDLEGEMAVRPFMEELGLTYPALIDSDFIVNDRYNVTSVPTSYLIDRDGIITNRFIGMRDWRKPRYKDLIVKLIESTSP
ncbi:MAG: TlpA disulfide reductase family protein [Nitrospirota bacterium]